MAGRLQSRLDRVNGPGPGVCRSGCGRALSASKSPGMPDGGGAEEYKAAVSGFGNLGIASGWPVTALNGPLPTELVPARSGIIGPSRGAPAASTGGRLMARVVVCGILIRGDRVLLVKRAASRAFYPGVWDFPGGHSEDGEAPEQTLLRRGAPANLTGRADRSIW